MIPVKIDERKCAGCGPCAGDCPSACLRAEGGKAGAREGLEGAGESAVPMTEIDSAAFLAAIKSRRSIRRFTGQPVEEEKINAILDAGRYAPTGANAQGVACTILGGRQAEAEAICVNLFRKGKKLAAPLASFLKRIEIADDFFSTYRECRRLSKRQSPISDLRINGFRNARQRPFGARRAAALAPPFGRRGAILMPTSFLI